MREIKKIIVLDDMTSEEIESLRKACCKLLTNPDVECFASVILESSKSELMLCKKAVLA